MRIQAKDGGSPPLSGTAVVIITINRNLFRPVFEPTLYTAEIDEILDLGTVIKTLNATDGDKRVRWIIEFLLVKGRLLNNLLQESYGKFFIVSLT